MAMTSTVWVYACPGSGWPCGDRMACSPGAPEPELWLGQALSPDIHLWVLHADLATALGCRLLDQLPSRSRLTASMARSWLCVVQKSLDQMAQMKKRYPDQVHTLNTAVLLAESQLSFRLEPIDIVWPDFCIEVLTDRLTQLQQLIPGSLLKISAMSLMGMTTKLRADDLMDEAIDALYLWLQSQSDHKQLQADHQACLGENERLRSHVEMQRIERNQLNRELEYYVAEHHEVLKLLPDIESCVQKIQSNC